MAVERIDCANDPRVAVYRDVRDGELVRARGLFVAEGRLIVRRVIGDGRHKVQSLLVNEAALRDLQPDTQGLARDVPIFVGNATQLAAIAGYEVHRGCLALVHRRSDISAADLLSSAQSLVVLDAVANADNVGGVFRNAAAFGTGGVLLSPTCCDPLYRKAIRTSMGATLQLPFARANAADWPDVVARLREAGFSTVALTPRDPSETLADFAARPRTARLALIVGTEGTGLTPALAAGADYRVRIPMAAGIDSLNLATATGIALYELRT
jgi:tRNA G18 (ribose-2'-O)-methylase SpoU